MRRTAEGVCTSRRYHKKLSLPDTADAPNDLRGTRIESQSSEETFSGKKLFRCDFFYFSFQGDTCLPTSSVFWRTMVVGWIGILHHILPDAQK